MKNKILLISIVFMALTSCDGQKNKDNNMKNLKTAPYNLEDEGDGIKYNYDTLSVDIVQYGKKSLQNFNFKFPDKRDFTNKLKEVYHWNMDEYTNSIIVLRQSKFPEIAIKDEKFILFQTPDSNNKFDIEESNLFYYNQYIFYDDRNAFNMLKLKDPFMLKDLVISYGYNKDKDLVKFVFSNFDFNNPSLFHDLIFDLDKNSNKYTIRKSIMDDIENIVFKGKTEDFSYAKEGNAYNRIGDIIKQINKNRSDYSNPDETIAYLYERELRIGVIGHIQEKIDADITYKPFLEKNDYFGYERLKDYVKYIYQPTDENTYTIQDPDGYTNLRKEKNSTSQILQKIKTGENIDVLNDSGDWFLIKTKEGKKGYIHKSRVKSD